MSSKSKKPAKAKPLKSPETEVVVPEVAPEAPPEIPEPVEPEAETPEPEVVTPEPDPSPVPDGPFAATQRDPRLPEIGAVITRQYKGAVIEVTVLEAGFELAGEIFSSISKVAAAATGNKTAAINGFAFFRLGTIPGGKAPGRGTGARLAAKITRIESLVLKLRVAVEAGQTALAEAEAEVEKMKGEVERQGNEK